MNHRKSLFLTGMVLFVLLLSGCAMDTEGAYENDRESADAFMQEYESEHQDYFQMLYGEGEVYSVSKPITEYQLEGWHTDRFLGALSPFPYYLKSNMSAFAPIHGTGVYHFIVYRGENRVTTYHGDNSAGVISIFGENNEFHLIEQMEEPYDEILMGGMTRLQGYLDFEGMDENQPMGFVKIPSLVFTTSQTNGYVVRDAYCSVQRTRDLAVSNYRVRKENRVHQQSGVEVQPSAVVYQATHYSTLPFWSAVIGIPIVLLLLGVFIYRLIYRLHKRNRG